MGSDKALNNAELELTQKIQMHFPRGVIPREALVRWNGCSTEFLTDYLTQIFSKRPELVVLENNIFRLITGNESLVVDSIDGKEILAEAKDVFGYIDSDFKNWGVDEKGPATEATPVQVYEMTKDATFSQMLGSLSSDLRKLCLTQAQIKNFVKKYRNWLRTDGYATFFLLESNSQFFVAGVDVGSGGTLEVRVLRFGHSGVWGAGRRHRLVVPQLAV